jgi:hypothetical protein
MHPSLSESAPKKQERCKSPKGSAQRKYQRTTGQKLAEPLGARRRSSPGSCNGLFSLGIPYRGSGAGKAEKQPQTPTSPDPANEFHHSSFPLPSIGAGPLQSAPSRQGATGRLHCLISYFPRVTYVTPGLQPCLQAATAKPPSRLQLCEHTNQPRPTQA